MLHPDQIGTQPWRRRGWNRTSWYRLQEFWCPFYVSHSFRFERSASACRGERVDKYLIRFSHPLPFGFIVTKTSTVFSLGAILRSVGFLTATIYQPYGLLRGSDGRLVLVDHFQPTPECTALILVALPTYLDVIE